LELIAGFSDDRFALGLDHRLLDVGDDLLACVLGGVYTEDDRRMVTFAQARARSATPLRSWRLEQPSDHRRDTWLLAEKDRQRRGRQQREDVVPGAQPPPDDEAEHPTTK
jgi:hypothetical protein